jgi:hypothetical protein
MRHDFLFGTVPSSAFRMFVGRHASVAEHVLLRLRAAYFGDFGSPLPERDAVKRSIELAISQVVPTPGAADADDGEPDLGVEYFYGKLREAGWLTEENERWRTWVDMPPGCRRLIAVLELLKEESTRSFTGLVSEVSTLIDAVLSHPERYATNVDGAARVAAAFRQRIAQIDAGLAEFARQLDVAENVNAQIGLFFADFLRTKIADWAGVMAKNNPWRSRNNIANSARALRQEPELLQQASLAYMEAGHATDAAQAELAIIARLDEIDQCFEDIERLRLRIEERQRAVETRLGNILRYIGRNPALTRQRVADALAALGRLPEDAELPVSFRLLNNAAPFGEALLAEAREPLEPGVKTPLRRNVPDPLHREYLNICREFDQLTSPGKRRLSAWLDMAQARGDAMPQTAAEWFAWRRIAMLAQWDAKIGPWRLRKSGTPAQSRYGALPGFDIQEEHES